MITVNTPLVAKNAQKYVSDCIKSGWLSSAGSYIDKFEKNFADFVKVKYAVTTTNGTASLHLAMTALEIGPGDEVIVPDLTIISCALAVIYTGAKPVLVDVEKDTGNIDPKKIEDKITKKTKAIMVVHLYGHPANMDPILSLAKKYNLKIIEDAAEAHGAEYKGKIVGGLGTVGCFSFYGNKIITTGEGGMLVTNDETLYKRAKLLKDLAHSPKRRFVHEKIGFNYRLTNIQAALGTAQLEEVSSYIEKKRNMAKLYIEGLKDIPEIELPKEMNYAKSVYWMFPILVSKNCPITRDQFREKLKNLGVDTRDFFYPLHDQPVLLNLGLFKNEKYPVTTDLSKRGFYIPSGLALTKKEITQVIKAIKIAINK
jgi:perosamine synthetase